MKSDTTIHIASPILDYSGYASIVRSVVPEIERLCSNLTLHSYSADPRFIAELKSKTRCDKEWKERLERKMTTGGGVCIIFHPPSLFNSTNFFQIERKKRPGFHSYVGFTMFETDRIPQSWVDGCNAMDEVWVPSEFNRETFASSGVDPSKIQVTPVGIDTNFYNPANVVPLSIKGLRDFNFLSVFQWNRRKGWDILLKAYLHAFSPQDDVSLVLRTYPDYIKEPPIPERIAKYIHSLGFDPKNIPPIILYQDFIPEELMPNLYKAADCFVLPTRGEGWGLPYMEAMAMGLPTIGTRWSANLTFMDDTNSYLIDLAGLSNVDKHHVNENPHYQEDQRWAEPSWEKTAELMRQAYNDREEARRKGAKARRDVENNWTLARAARWTVDRCALLNEPASQRPLVPKYYEKTIGIDGRSFIYDIDSSTSRYNQMQLIQCIDQTPHWRYLLFIDDFISTPGVDLLLSRDNVDWRYIDDLTEEHLDLYHIPEAFILNGGFDSPFLKLPDCPVVVGVNRVDGYMSYVLSEKLTAVDEIAYKRRLQQLIKSDLPVITSSDSNRYFLLNALGLSPEIVKSVGHGVFPRYQRLPWNEKRIAALERRLNIKRPYILSTGILESVHDYINELVAFQRARELCRNDNGELLSLVYIGSLNTDIGKQVVARLVDKENIQDVQFIESVGEDDMEGLYRYAVALLALMDHNGSDYSVTEALSCSCPVVVYEGSELCMQQNPLVMAVPRSNIKVASETIASQIKEPRKSMEIVEDLAANQWVQVGRETLLAWQHFIDYRGESVTANNPAGNYRNYI